MTTTILTPEQIMQRSSRADPERAGDLAMMANGPSLEDLEGLRR